eukprot:10799028-Karenia_brevis.AAC.1
MTKPIPGLDAGEFPLIHRSTSWNLYESTDTKVTIHTKGFAISPYFSFTIDSMTGKPVDKAIVDLQQWEALTRYSTAMKAYIALSR